MRFTLPRQWEDWCSWGLGIWLCISPWALQFDLEPTATRAAVVSGLLIILTELVTLSLFRLSEEWINVVLGVWLVVAPWILAVTGAAAVANFVIVGLLVLVLAVYEIWQGGPSEIKKI